MKCAVTGANGYLGRRLKEYFEKQGWDVFCLSRTENGREQVDGAFFDLKGHIDPVVLRPYDVLIHCAYDFSVRRWKEIVETNVKGSINLFYAAQAAGVGKIVFISSISSFDNCKSEYGKAKLLIEGEAKKSGAIIVRPGLVYDSHAGGMFGALQKAIKTMPFVCIIGKGDQRQYMVHSEDLCRFIFMLATMSDKPQNALTVAYEKAFTIKEIARIIAESQQRPLVFVHLPARLAYWCLKLMEVLGIKTRLRSDSLVSLMQDNPSPSFTEMRLFGFHTREFSVTSLGADSYEN